MTHLFEKLPNDKIKISWNKNPITMELFKNFITIDLVRSTDHLGSCTGWTLLYNEEYKLKVTGGVYKGVEYIDHIEFGEKLQNRYNNYVNPFYLKDIITKEGINYFLDYYKDEINEVIQEINESIEWHRNKIREKELELKYINEEINKIINP